MLRSEPLATPAAAAIRWPVMIECPLASDSELPASEPALLVHADGRREPGVLKQFDPAGEILHFSDARGNNRRISFDTLRELRLTRPVVMGPAVSARDGLELSAAAQPYSIELTGGQVLVGEACGYKKTSAGTFLIISAYANQVLRVFFPRTAIRSQLLGRRLGEALVADQAVSEANLRLALAEQARQHAQPLGQLLAENAVITREQLHAALERQASMPMARIGDTLVDMKLISPAQLADGLELQKSQRKKALGNILVELGLISGADLARALSRKLGFPLVDLSRFAVDPEAVRMLPADLVRELSAMPLCREGSALVIALENPLDANALEQLRFAAQVPVLPVLADALAIRRNITTYYGDQKSVAELSERLSTEMSGQAAADAAIQAQSDAAVRDTDTTLVQLVNKIILDAHAMQASDIHIECNRGHEKVVVRFRRDGELSDYLQLPSRFRSALVSRIKIMADLDISEHRRGQDGRIDFSRFGAASIELRVAVLPTGNGLEDIVMRLLGASTLLPFGALGFRKTVASGLEQIIHRPHGLLLVSGPTGSGKTMTLHSLLAEINTRGRKIWTAEDPVEITQSGLRQVQVNSRIGWTFASAIRMFLRADPDVIMVGEMRDVETSKIAIEAALTGHLVCSTLHTNSAAESVVRLIELGMDPFNFADSLLGVLGQRLARRLCPNCRRRRLLGEDETHALAQEYCADSRLKPEDVLAEWHGRFGASLMVNDKGACEQCAGKGYRGRIGIHELLSVDAGLRRLIHARASAAQVQEYAIEQGMRTLRQDGIEKVLAGETDLSEVRSTTL